MTRPNINTPPDETEPPTSMTSPTTPDIASAEPPKWTLKDVDYTRRATQHKGVKGQRTTHHAAGRAAAGQLEGGGELAAAMGSDPQRG